MGALRYHSRDPRIKFEKIHRTSQTVAVFPEMLCRRIKVVLASGSYLAHKDQPILPVWTVEHARVQDRGKPSQGA